MCSHYQAIKERERFFRLFGVYPPDPEGKDDMWPGYTGAMLRHPATRDAGDDAVADVEAKRMVVILPRAMHSEWLDASTHQSMALLQPFPADKLVATP